jgi:hypothetical protein
MAKKLLIHHEGVATGASVRTKESIRLCVGWTELDWRYWLIHDENCIHNAKSETVQALSAHLKARSELNVGSPKKRTPSRAKKLLIHHKTIGRRRKAKGGRCQN